MHAKSFLAGLLVPCLLLSTMPARAGMISTTQMLAPAADAQRERVDAFLAREDVQQQFEAMGVSQADAAVRVASLTESELQELSSNIESLPAGAGALELVLVFLLILVVLELVGAINIFSRI
jgi:DNA-directed RNA polymerase beta' subunit